MKLFKNSLLTLKVASCEECPHKTAQRHKTAKGFGSHYVCAAITITPSIDKPPYHPAISEARFYGGFLPRCPLEDI